MTRTLAIGIDAAEPSLVHDALDALPNLKRTLDSGTWSRVVSPAHIGSGAVWPSFFTGTDAGEHGVHSEWSWHPEAMALRRYDGRVLTPFWHSLPSVGVLDVPFAPFGFVRDGFEVAHWGPHDRLEDRSRTMPAVELPRHPFADGRADATSCIEGARLRGDVAARLLREHDPELAIVVFTEVHHASHPLWSDREAIVAVLREGVDAQIGRLNASRILIFSLHGMRAARGLASLLEPLLIEKDYAVRASRSFRSLFAAMKRHAPLPLKKLYYRMLPHSARTALARPTMLPAYDWSHTRAFALPSDQHGWIRINLRGREAQGIVEPRDYDALRDELESMLRATGFVTNVIRTQRDSALPDLVVHWNENAEAPLASGKVQTGQHAPDGFLIARGVNAPPTVHAHALHQLMI